MYSDRHLAKLVSVVLGLALTGSVTEIMKITVGRPRPGMQIILVHFTS